MADCSESSNTTTNTISATSPEPSSSTTAAQPPASKCANCSKSSESLKQCLKCHSVSYCNKDCQKAHFKIHKKQCASLAQEYVKAHEPKMASRSTASTKGARDKGLQKWQFDT